jgi:sugar/nucleoside kinase (ribokinase family)
VVLGGVAWNTMVHLDHLPDPVPHTLFPRRVHETLGSSGAGKATNLRRLGCDVTLWAALGDDERGARVRSALAASGVTLVAEHDPAGTMHHVNLMAADGGRISVFVNGGSHDLTVDTAPVRAALADAGIVFLGIFNPCRAFLPLLAELDVPVMVDVHDYDGDEAYHRAFVDAADVLFLSDVKQPDPRPFMEGRLAAGTSVVVCTRGARGAIGATPEEGFVEVPALPVPAPVDANGAGDAFSAAFAVAWRKGADLHASLCAGAAMGAAAVQSDELAPDHCPDGVVRA